MRNSLTAIGVMVAIFLAILFIYISALQGLFNTRCGLPNPTAGMQAVA